MPRTVTFHETPNPHALKCVLSEPLMPLAGIDAVRSYTSQTAASADPAAVALFAVPGIRGVLIADTGAWITVTKDPGTAWKSLRPAVEACLRSVP